MNGRWRQERANRVVAGACLDAARSVRGLFRKSDHPEYNEDAERTWHECSVRTRAAIELTKGTMAAERARQQSEAPRAFGIVFMTPKITNEQDWEKFAKSGGKVIDTTAGLALLEESKNCHPDHGGVLPEDTEEAATAPGGVLVDKKK